MWYAPKRIPSTVEPERLSGKVRSVNVVDSVALANTKEFPVPATATQSICRCQFETSIPESPVCACALVSGREGGRRDDEQPEERCNEAVSVARDGVGHDRRSR